MTEAQIRALEPALASFLDRYLFCCDYTQTFDHFATYCRGLLSDLPRKSVEPIALAAGTPVRTLQEFLKDHGWSFPRARDFHQKYVAEILPARDDDDDRLGTVGLVDETGIAKKGTKTPGIQRQYCGELGKIENCVVTVHLGVAKGRFKTLIDGDLFLPEAWDHDRARCQAAGIPDDVRHRPKSVIALEEIDRALGNGVRFDWMTFDEEYGKCPAFLGGLGTRQLRYVGEVPKVFRCFVRKPRGPGKGTPIEELAQQHATFRKQAGQRVRLARQTLAAQVWQVKAVRGWLQLAGATQAAWLLVATSEETGEVKYFVSNAPAKTSVRRLMQVALRRWHVEHCLRVEKTELGLRHFEGRSWVGLLRHLTLCELMLTFVAEQADRLRGEKSGGDDRASVPGAAGGVCRVAGGAAAAEGTAEEATADGCGGAHGDGAPVSPETQPGGAAVPPKAA
jgi:SRSO17 transposase